MRLILKRRLKRFAGKALFNFFYCILFLESLDACKARTVFRRKLVVLNQKARALIGVINKAQSPSTGNLIPTDTFDELIENESTPESDDDVDVDLDIDLDDDLEESKPKSKQFKGTENKTEYVSEENYRSGVFPWNPNSSRKYIPFTVFYLCSAASIYLFLHFPIATRKGEFEHHFELVDSWMNYHRYKEEIFLVESEMKSFLSLLIKDKEKLNEEKNILKGKSALACL